MTQTKQGFGNERVPKIALEAMSALAKYLQTHDEMYLMDAYRLLKDEVGADA